MNYFAQSRLEKRHPYIVYVINAHYRTDNETEIADIIDKKETVNDSKITARFHN